MEPTPANEPMVDIEGDDDEASLLRCSLGLPLLSSISFLFTLAFVEILRDLSLFFFFLFFLACDFCSSIMLHFIFMKHIYFSPSIPMEC